MMISVVSSWSVSDENRYLSIGILLRPGMPETDWEDYYYASLEEIPSPDKALVRWLKEI